MKFVLIDKVVELKPGQSIKAVKALSLAEEYLGDHFPTYPVLPGVMMIEALVQAAAMLVRVTNDFAHSMVILEEARNVKYKSFVKPGNLLELEVQAKNIELASSSFKARAQVGDQVMVEARLKLCHFNLAERDETLAEVDERLIKAMKDRARLVGAC